MALDQHPCHRAAHQTGKNHAECGTHHTDDHGIFRAQLLIHGRDGTGCSHAAHQGQRAHADPLQRMQAKRNRQCDPQNILGKDQADDGDGNAQTQFGTAFSDQFPRSRQSNTGKEDIHEPLFQYAYVPVDGQDPAGAEQSQRQAYQQAADDHPRDTVGLKELYPLDDPSSHHDHRRGNGTALHNVK